MNQIATLAMLLLAASAAQGQVDPRYASQLEAELETLGLHPVCTTTSTTSVDCSYPARSSLEQTDLTAHAHYDDTTDSVYLYVPLFTLPDTAKTLPALLRRTMELNWELLGAKLEWSPRNGELRLSALMHTDSNFDRRALRSLVRALDRLTMRYYLELHQLAGSPTPK